MSVAPIAGAVLAGAFAVWALSYIVEFWRKRPRAPAALSWSPDAVVRSITIDGVAVRCVQGGSGPHLVLLHTLRTQLDIFQKVFPPLTSHFTVHAFDFPGHGWSDIPRSPYSPEDFYRWTACVLDHLNVPKAALAGISIGGTIALVLAARGHPRVASVIAINPYDYAPAGGIRKSSFVARLILGPAAVPVLGTTLMRLRNPWVSNRIMRGGVVASAAIPVALAHELYAVGNRPGHYAGFLNLLEHEREWKRARDEYSSIKTPTLLIYGARDWAPLSERHAEQALLPQATARTIPEAGHFLSLDRPVELVSAIVEFLKPQASGAVSGAGAGT